MKLVLFSDSHLEATFRWAGRDLARTLRGGIRTALERIVDLAIAEDAEALLCAGDLFEHEHATDDTGAFLRAEFARAGRPVLVAPGNHDHLGPASLYRRVRWTENVHVFAARRPEPYELAAGFTIWGAAHHEPTGTPNLLAGLRVDRGGVNLGLLHASEESGLPFESREKAPHAPFRASDVAVAGLDHLLCGHYHTPRHDALVTYPGNPQPLAFGERGARGPVVVEVSDEGRLAVRTVEVASAAMHDVTVDVTGCEHGAEARARVAEALAGLGGVARVNVEGEVGPTVDFGPAHVEDVESGLAAVVRGRFEVREAYDVEGIARQQTVRGQFVRDVLASGLDDESKRRIVATGLRAFDERDDLEVP